MSCSIFGIAALSSVLHDRERPDAQDELVRYPPSRPPRRGRKTKEVDAFTDEAVGHLDALYAVACKLTRNPSEAEDLVQDTLLKAMRAREQFHAGTNLKAWLFRILTNTFINKYRRGGLERSVLEGPDADPLVDGWVSASTMRHLRDPEAQALAADRRGRGPARARCAPDRLQDRRHPLRRRGVQLRGDRADHGLPDRHRHEPPPPRPKAPSAISLQPRPRARYREGRADVGSCVRIRQSAKTSSRATSPRSEPRRGEPPENVRRCRSCPAKRWDCCSGRTSMVSSIPSRRSKWKTTSRRVRSVVSAWRSTARSAAR